MDENELGGHGVLPEENAAGPFSVKELFLKMLGADERIHGIKLEGDGCRSLCNMW